MTLINKLPNPPLRSDGFSSSEAETFLEALPAFVTETNTALDYFNLRNADASAVTMWETGSYDEGDAVWSPLTGKNYRAKGTHTSATDPSADSTNWSLATGLTAGDQDKLDLMTVTEAINLDTLNVRPTMTADGAISKGDVLVRQNDGTVAGVTSAVSGPATSDIETFTAGSIFIQRSGVAVNPTTGKFLIVYQDDANGDFGTAVVATVSGGAVTFSSPVVYAASATTTNIVSYDPTNDNFLICYKDIDDSNNLKAIVCTVSGTTPSFGSPVSSGIVIGGCSLFSYDTGNNKFLLVYLAASDLHPQSIVISVSGTTPSFGTSVEIVSVNFAPAAFLFYDATAGKHVFGSYQSPNFTGYVGTISGTSISWGSSQTLASSAQPDAADAAGPDANGKYLVTFKNQSDSGHLYAMVLSISSATISTGTPVEFQAGSSNSLRCEYFPDDDEFWTLYSDVNNSSYLTSKTITISGTVPSASTATVVVSENGTIASAFDSTANVVLVAYRRFSSPYGAAFSYQSSSITTDADSWFSIAANDVTNGEDTQLFTLGDLAGGLSGLTIGADYYVDVDGTLTTSVTSYGKIGRALSATELLITGTNS